MQYFEQSFPFSVYDDAIQQAEFFVAKVPLLADQLFEAQRNLRNCVYQFIIALDGLLNLKICDQWRTKQT